MTRRPVLLSLALLLPLGAAAQMAEKPVWDVGQRCFRLPSASACGAGYDVSRRSWSGAGSLRAVQAQPPAQADATAGDPPRGSGSLSAEMDAEIEQQLEQVQAIRELYRAGGNFDIQRLVELNRQIRGDAPTAGE